MRKCFQCGEEIPQDTEHFHKDGEHYCTNCVEIVEYTAYQYYVDGEYLGGSESDTVDHVEAYEDDYEIEEAELVES